MYKYWKEFPPGWFHSFLWKLKISKSGQEPDHRDSPASPSALSPGPEEEPQLTNQRPRTRDSANQSSEQPVDTVQVSNSSTTTISGYGVDRGGPGPASHHPSAYDDSTPLLNRQQTRGPCTTPLPPPGSGETVRAHSVFSPDWLFLFSAGSPWLGQGRGDGGDAPRHQRYELSQHRGREGCWCSNDFFVRLRDLCIVWWPHSSHK